MRLRIGLRTDRADPSGRSLYDWMVDPFAQGMPYRRRPNARGKWCSWCGQPTAGLTQWHPECVRWYLVAKGLTVWTGGGALLFTQAENERRYRRSRRRYDAARDYAHAVADRELVKLGLPPLYRGADPASIAIPDGPEPVGCAECGEPYSEVDHTAALSVAWERRRHGDRRWWRAWIPANLRPLCSKCHSCKTGADRRALAAFRNPQGALF